MTTRLVLDCARRMRTTYAMPAVLIFMQAWLLTATRSGRAAVDSGSNILAWSMTACWFMAFMAMPSTEVREVSQLPIPRREMWIVRWWLAVVVPPVVVAAGVALGTLLNAESAVLSRLGAIVLFCSLYGGCYTALAAIFPLRPMTEPGGMTRAAMWFLLIPVGGALLPFRLAKSLPLQLAELSGGSLALVAAAALATIASYFYRPPIVERSSPPRLQSEGDDVLPTPVRRDFRDYLPGNLLTGLPRLFWVHAREIALVAPFGFVMIWFLEIATESGSSNSIRHMLHRMQLMPFDVDYVFDGRRGFNVMIWVFISMGLKMREVMQRARALRVLLMTARRLSLVFSALSVTTAAVIWLWLIGVHRAVTGEFPSILRLDIFIIFSGALMLMRSVELAIPSRFAGQLVGMLTFMPLVFAATFVFTSPNAAMVVIGTVCAVAGTVFQTWLLRRRHKVYQFKPTIMFGKEIPS